jgi:hypothetical protein
MPDARSGIGERRRKLPRTVTVSLQQVKRDALCGFLPNTRHAAQAVNQAYE